MTENNSAPMNITDPTVAVEKTHQIMRHFLAAADVNAVYGQPVEHGEDLIIPVAEILSLAGFGAGSGGSTGADDPSSNGGGGGGGGGGRVFSRPVAVIVASPDKVRVKPVVDVTKIALAWFTMVGFIFASLVRMQRGKIKQ
jgi:uncharacterized spore protein YtfJ